MNKTDTDIFDEPKPKPKRKQKPGLLTRQPEDLSKPKNDPEVLRRARRAAKKLLREEQGAVVCILVASGIPDKTIARMLKMDIRSLRKNFSAELEDGGFEATGRVAQVVFNAAINGNLTSAMFWLKSKGGFKESAELDIAVTAGRDLSDVERSQRMMALFMKNPNFLEASKQKSLEQVHGPAVQTFLDVMNPAAQKAIDVTSTSKEEEEEEEEGGEDVEDSENTN